MPAGFLLQLREPGGGAEPLEEKPNLFIRLSRSTAPGLGPGEALVQKREGGTEPLTEPTILAALALHAN